MDELIEILEDIGPDVDYTKETNLIDGKVLDSFTIIKLIGEICDTFDLDCIPQKYMVNANFNSVQAMWEMIQNILDEE